MKRTIRLNESELKRMIAESVKKIISEVSGSSKSFKYRFDPNKRVGDFPLEQPEWTKDPRWQGWTGEDPEWIMKQHEEGKDIMAESKLHHIVKESVEHVLSEGLFGNDARYGEKWYNPFSWVSDKEKAEIDKSEKARQKRLRDIANRRRAQEKEDAENNMKWRKSEAEKAQRKYAQSHRSGAAYYHAGEPYSGGSSAYDAGLR